MSPRRYRLEKRLQAAQRTRDRIVEAALALHADKGITATTMLDIARKADVAPGTLYRHFGSLDEVRPACGERVLETMRPPTPDAVSAGRTPADRVRILCRELFAAYDRAAPWIAAGRRARHELKDVDEGFRHLDELHVALARAALGESAGNERVALTRALTDFDVWRSLRGAGIETARAAELVTSVLRSSVSRVRTEKRKGEERRRKAMTQKRRGSV